MPYEKVERVIYLQFLAIFRMNLVQSNNCRQRLFGNGALCHCIIHETFQTIQILHADLTRFVIQWACRCLQVQLFCQTNLELLLTMISLTKPNCSSLIVSIRSIKLSNNSFKSSVSKSKLFSSHLMMQRPINCNNLPK